MDAFDPCQHHGLGNSFETADSDKENVELYGEGETNDKCKLNYMTQMLNQFVNLKEYLLMTKSEVSIYC